MTTQARELAKLISNAGDLTFGDDIHLLSDAGVLNFGADNDVTLTHVADTGLLLNSSRQLQFGDSGTHIRQSADGVLQLTSDTEVEINATTIDINGNVDISGNLVLGGNITIGDADSDDISFGGELTSHIIPNADDTYDLGSSTKQWRNAYVDGTLYADVIDLAGSTLIPFTPDAAQTFNDSGAAVDFRIEGDSEQNLFFVDGSADKIGIGLAGPVTKLNVQGASASTYTGAGPSDILRVSQSTAGAWIASDFDGAFAYMGNDSSTTAKFAAYNYATTAEMNMILGQDRMYIKSDGDVGIGTQSPGVKLDIASSGQNVFRLDTTNSDGPLQIFRNNGTVRGYIGNAEGILSQGTTNFGIRAQAGLYFGTGGANTRMAITSAGKIIIGDTGSHVDDLLQIETPASGGGHGIQIRRNDSNGDQGIGRLMFGNNNDSDLATISAKTDGQADCGALLFSTQPTSGATTERMRIESGGNIRQLYATDAGSNARFTTPINPQIAQVGLQGYWDPTKAADGTDFSPSTHGNGNQDLTLGSGVTHVTNSGRAMWQFDGTSNASMHGNPNLSAGKSFSFSLWIYWNNVNSLSSSYQLNGVQIGNHYMYIGILQGANDIAPLYGYAGQGTNIPPSSANDHEQAYVNSDEWVYLTIQAGHGSSDVTGRTKGRAEVYLNGSLVQRRDAINLATTAANGSSSFYLGRVQGGYYLDGYIGPAVLYERTLHQWEILENMRVHADMYMA